MEGASDAALIAATGSSVAAVILALSSLVIQEIRFRRQSRAEKAVQTLLKVRGWKMRSFDEIKGKLGGYADDELRRLLVRSGAVRFRQKESGNEMWGLLSRNKDAL